MSRVTLLTAGSRGDVDPYIALGVGLRRSGYDVRVATHEGFRVLVEAHGLDFAPVAQPSSALSSSKSWQRWQRSAGNVAAYIYYFRQIARRAGDHIRTMLGDFWRACQGSDLIVSSTSGIAGPQMAAHLGVPHAWALFQPMSPTRARPHFMTPNGYSLGPFLNRWTYAFAERVYWLLFAPALRQWQRETLGSALLRGNHAGTFLSDRPGALLYGFSQHVFPRPSDWSTNIQICGFWMLEPPPAWQPPQELVDFLNAGPPPIYFYLSGIKFTPWEELLSMAVAALEQNGQRGLLYAGVRGRADVDLPPSVMAVGPVPHNWLFPQVCGVVHHGGAGTTACAWQAGAPIITIPGFWDQSFWGRRVHALGTGPSPIALRALNRERLARAIQLIVADPGFKQRAATLSARLDLENGVQNAVRYLNNLKEGALNGATGLASN